jgi:prepilin-type processing-associated H-X9-DG protein
MCIAFGSNVDSSRRRVDDNNGPLQAGPAGIGYLAATGYLGELFVYYCPSWQIPSGRVRASVNHPDGYRTAGYGQINNRNEVASLGGATSRHLTHGNYYVAGVQSGGSSSNGWYIGSGSSNGSVGMQSSYCYRNFPVRGQMGTGNYNDREGRLAEGYSDWVTYPVHYTTPLVVTEMGCPSFKTDKQLAGRSIMADSFVRGTQDNDPDAMRPGFGVYHHKDGYNVLYGDGHAAWYGDPQQRIMWHATTTKTNGSAVVWDTRYIFPHDYASQRIGTLAGCTVDSVMTRSTSGQIGGRNEIYHQFDLLAGIDKGALPLP